MQTAPAGTKSVEGNSSYGFIAGFFGGIVGLLIVMLVAKGKKTKRGAIYGVIAQLLVGGTAAIGGGAIFHGATPAPPSAASANAPH
jgi:hypothetical protein